MPLVLAFALVANVSAAVGAAARSHGAVAPSYHSSSLAQHRSAPLSAKERTLRYAAANDFAFLDPPSKDGEVDRWDPCAPIHYVVNVVKGDPDDLQLVRAAVHEAAHESGLTFVYDGTTTEMPSSSRKDVRHHGVGWQWSPVLIALVPHADYHAQDNDADSVAFTDPDIYSDDDTGDSEIVSGQIVVDIDAMTQHDHYQPDVLMPTMLHELGHLVGLGHVDYAYELMAPDGGGLPGYGHGDRAGLSYLGKSHGCIADPAMPQDSEDFPG